MMKNWKAIAGVLLIFVFGFIAGGLCTSMIAWHRAAIALQKGPAAMVNVLERRLTRTLDLDPAQRREIHACFMENLRQRRRLQQTIQPQVQLLNAQTVQQIDAVLRPEQLQRFHENIGAFRKNFGKVMPEVSRLGQPPEPAPVSNSAPTPQVPAK